MNPSNLEKITEACRNAAMSFDPQAQWWNDFWNYLGGFSIGCAFVIIIGGLLYGMIKSM